MNEKDADEVVLFVTPSALEANGGDKIYFDIWSKTINQQLISFEVSSFDSTNGAISIYNTEPNQKVFSYRYIFDVPNIDTEKSELELTFSVKDNLGYTRSVLLRLIVNGRAEALDELTGVTLYSPFSGKEDAFSFSLKQKIKSQDSEQQDVDLFIIADDSAIEVLGRSWGSMTGMRFCKANNFNYANATKQSIAAIYGSSITSAVVADIDIDDIILVGNEMNAIAAIRVVNVYDEEGFAKDRYDINLKLIDTKDNNNNDSDIETASH